MRTVGTTIQTKEYIMAPKDANIKDKTKDRPKLGVKLSEFLTDLRAKVSNDDDDRANWKMKAIVSNNQRLGVKRRTNYPYPNAPNFPLPETDKLIKKSVPNLVMSAWSPKKKCLVQAEAGLQVDPQVKMKAQKTEMAMNMLLSHKMDWFHKLMLAADFRKQYGFCIFRIYEDFKTRIIHRVIDLEDYPPEAIAQLKASPRPQMEQFLAKRYNFVMTDDVDKGTVDDIISQLKSGKTVIEFDQEEISSLPNVEVVLPTKITVPAYTTDINKATRICYEYFLSREDLESKMEDEIFKKKDIEDLEFSGVAKGDDDFLEQTKGRNEGVQDNSTGSDLYRIHEICCWYKPEGEKRYRKWVFTFFADVYDAESALLQDIPFPFEFEGWNYEKDDNEIKDPRYYSSRGTPEKIRAYQELMERSLNNMLIRDEMNNTPMWEVSSTSEIMDSHIRFVPGEKIPVGQIGSEIKRLNEPTTVDVSSQQVIQLTKAFVEEYEGSTDQLFKNATNKGGGKTLGEVQEGIRQVTGPLSVDVISWNETLSRVYKKVFDIMKERLGESIYVDNIPITREDFNFPAEVKSNGNLEVSDMELATQKALMRWQIATQAMQLGVANQEDVYNAYVDWLEKDGVKIPDQFATHPMEIMKTQLAQMQQQMQQMGQQAQELQKTNQDGTKQLSKTKKKYDSEISKSEGTLEAIREGFGK